MTSTPVSSRDALRVLLADDTVEIRILLRRVLELDDDVEVVGEAANGLEAVELSGIYHPDVILLDLAMPVMDGLQAIPEIRRCSPMTRIVVLSAFNASDMEAAVFAAGASAFLSKGTRPDRILATVREFGREIVNAPAVSAESEYRRRHDPLHELTHEIGNHLTVIQGFAEILLDGVDSLPAASRQRFTEAIVRSAGQMRNLLEASGDAETDPDRP